MALNGFFFESLKQILGADLGLGYRLGTLQRASRPKKG